MPVSTVYNNLNISVYETISVLDVFGNFVDRIEQFIYRFSALVMYTVKSMILDMIFVSLNNHASPPNVAITNSQIKKQNRA